MKKALSYKIDWTSTESVLTPELRQILELLLDVAKTARVYVNHDSPKGSILLPQVIKKAELERALAALDKELR